MIRFFLVYNTKGITRLTKFYVPSPDNEKKAIIKQLHDMIMKRDATQPRYFPYHGNTQILYRRYQQLYFCMCIEDGDNVLAYLESIHLFVTVLNRYFNPVSELDIMYNFNKVYGILDEVYLAGEVMETSTAVVMKQLALMDQ